MVTKTIILFVGTLLLIGAQKSSTNKTINNQPIIGILTLPSDSAFSQVYPPADYSYITSTFVKFVQGAGARVAPIPHDASTDYLIFLMESLNGLLLTGGNSDLWVYGHIGNKIATPLLEKIKLLINKAVEFNSNGDYFPVWGTQQGMNAILLALGNDMNILDKLDLLANNIPLKFVSDDNVGRLYSLLTEDLRRYSVNNNLFWIEAQYGITSATFNNSNLSSILQPLTTGIDSNGTEYISSLEGTKYPFYLVAFDPEISSFDWSNKQYCHTFSSIKVAQRMVFRFVNDSRSNFHSFPNTTIENSTLIYNYNVTLLPEIYNPLYIFSNSEEQTTVA